MGDFKTTVYVEDFYKRISFFIILILWILPILLRAEESPIIGRTILKMNTHWAFHRGDLQGAEKVDYDDRDWAGVSIPHVMRLERKHNGGGDVYQGVGWYRRYFHLPNRYMEKRISLHFEGVQTNCQVFLNGEKIASHAGGYLGFVVDITKFVHFGDDNTLVVRVDNRDDEQTPPGQAA